MFSSIAVAGSNVRIGCRKARNNSEDHRRYDDIEATLITIRVAAVGPDSNPIEDQTDIRDRASSNETPKWLFSVFQAPSILGVAMRIDLGHCALLPRGQTGLRSSSRSSGPGQCHPHHRLQVELGIRSAS
jgi:hypothetical protein